MKNYRLYLFLGLAGSLAGFSFPPSLAGVLAYVCFVPLIIVLEKNSASAHPQRLLYTFFFCFHGAANWWVMSWQKETDPYLMAAGAGLWLGHPFFLMPAFWLYQYFRKRCQLSTSLALLVLSWTAIEWLHSLSDLSYPWLALGYTQSYYTWIIQIADVGGVWLVGMLVMTVNALIAHGILTRSRPTRHVIALSCLLLLVYFYGTHRLSTYDSTAKSQQDHELRVGLVQPSINPWRKWQGGITEMITMHQRLQDSLNSIQHCDVCVWSETAIPIGLTLPENSSVLRMLHEWVDTSRTALLTGFADYELFPPGQAPDNAQDFALEPGMKIRVFNAAGILSPGTTNIPRHHKSKLTPFGEYMPFSDDFPIIQSWLKWGVGISGWNRGAGATVLPFVRGEDTLALIGPVICIESIYPHHVADYVRRGATMLAVITNDAWYDGTFGPEQHYCISRMRAVETRRSIMRCGNSGVSGFISASGRSVVQATEGRSLALFGTITERHELSFYVQWGDWLPIISSIIVALGFLWLVIYKKRAVSNSVTT